MPQCLHLVDDCKIIIHGSDNCPFGSALILIRPKYLPGLLLKKFTRSKLIVGYKRWSLPKRWTCVPLLSDREDWKLNSCKLDNCRPAGKYFGSVWSPQSWQFSLSSSSSFFNLSASSSVVFTNFLSSRFPASAHSFPPSSPFEVSGSMAAQIFTDS